MKILIKKILSKFYYYLKTLSKVKGGKSSGSHLIVGSELSGNIKIGLNTKIFYSIINGNVIIGDFTSLWGPNITLEGTIEIGSYCSIARNVSFQESYHNYHRISSYLIWKNVFNETSSNELITKGKISVGSDVWIGMNSSILSGVNIGHGAIIGANTLVNSDVPPYSIFAGIPGRVIGYRFDDKIIEKLLIIEWWEWPLEKLSKHKEIFRDNLTIEMLDSFED